MKFIFNLLIFSISTFALPAEYFVANSYGNDDNNGTSLAFPFKTIEKAATVISAGDVCYIRQGIYHETINIDNVSGSDGMPILFTSFNNEKVVMDGTKSIDSVWTLYSDNIWRTTISFDIWQLFVDRTEVIMARWPNASFEDGSIWDKANHWGHGTIDIDQNAYSNGTLIDSPHGEVNLAESGLNIVDAIAILNVGSFKTWTRKILTHNGNTFTYLPVPDWKTKHHDYFLEGKLNFLDSENEWFFDPETKELFFYPSNGLNPNDLNIRGKVQSYAFEITNSDFVQIKDIDFFSTTFKFTNSDYGLVEECNLFYPSCYKRMLGIVDTPPDMSLFTSSSNSKVYKSAFRYTDGSALEMYSGNNIIEDCYFYHIDYTATDLNGLMTTIQMGGSNNIFRNNTMHKLGASATLNPGNEALIELNDMSDSGYMQSDGALIQCMVGQQPGTEIRYNWLHDTIKYGARFDGNGAGNNGLMHHNVIWNVQGGIMVKGFEHNLFNNTAFDNGDKNDIIVMIDQGGNEGTITRNNAANKIAGHRSGSYQDYPVPGIYDNNWNGYETNQDIKDFLIDPENYDFRPHPDSELIDAGVNIAGITDEYVGEGPDQGAYEYGGEMWVPGISWGLDEVFGNEFTEPQPLYNGSLFHVSLDGSNNNDGTLGNPFSSIQFAYDRVGEEDTILVHPGVYNDNILLNGKNVILGSLYLVTGDTSFVRNTVIDGDSADCPLLISGNIDSTCRVTGFTLQNGIGCVYGQGGGIYIESSSPRLDNLIIKNNNGGTNGGGICLNDNSDCLIDYVVIENNSADKGGGLYSFNSNPIITNSVIQNNRSNHGAGVYLELCSSNFNNVIIVNNDAVLSGGGIYCGISSNPLFDHTTISDNLASIGGGILSTQNSQPVFSNSILWNDFPEEVISHPDSLTITFSNIQGGWQGAGNINLDPLFCMIENGDYTLAENSPCLELGEEGFGMGALGLGCSAINLPPSEFSLLDPVNNYQIFIDMDNENQSLVFRWEISEDENGDSLVYRLYFISEEFLMDSIETSNSEIEIPFSYFIDALLLNEINSDTIIWDVSVTDSFEFISSNNGPFSFFIDIDGILSMNEDNIVPERFALHQNYPNPFNPITTIRYDLPHDSFVELIIYDLMGDMINTLVFQQESVGYKQIKWDGKNNYGLPTAAGIYFYKIQTESFMQTKKMILLK